MEFKTLNYKITEKFSTVNWKIPHDKEELMYDFYLLVSLPLWGLKGSASKAPDPDADMMVSIIEEYQKKIVKVLKAELLNVVFFAIASEFRHYMAFSTYDNLKNTININDFMKWFKKLPLIPKWESEYKTDLGLQAQSMFDVVLTNYLKSEHQIYDMPIGKIQSANAAKSSMSREKFVKMAMKAFEDPNGWGRFKDYGGPAWASIAKGWQKLNAANSYSDQVVWIDHIFDLQHNTDSVLNKSQEYAKDGGYEWIHYALNVKKNARSLFDIIRRASPSLKSISAKITKAATGDTLEKFMKSEGYPGL